MRRLLGVCLLAGILGTVTVPALAEESPGGQQVVSEAVVVKTVVKRPPGVVHRRVRFRPPAHPTASYLFRVIVPYETHRWGADSGTIARRIRCESGGHWWASNGQYNGVGQFARSTQARGLTTIRSYRVRLVERVSRLIHARIYHHWSDGRISRQRGKVVRQRVVVKRVGRISRDYLDAWTQVRIMSQAQRGISAVHDSEWECRGR